MDYTIYRANLPAEAVSGCVRRLKSRFTSKRKERRFASGRPAEVSCAEI